MLEGLDVDDLDDGVDPVKGYRSLIVGNDPVVKQFDSAEKEAEWLVTEINQLVDQGVPPRDICLVGRLQRALNLPVQYLRNNDVEVAQVKRDATDTYRETGIRVATMHRVKGLEFKCVFGGYDGTVPLTSRVN